MKIWMKNFFATEAAKMRGMTIKEKWQYIWEYYKLQIIILLIILVIVLYSIFSTTEDTYLYGAWFGTPVSQEQLHRLGEMLSVIAYEDNSVVAITSYLATGDMELDMALSTRFFAMVQAGFIHMFLATDEALVGYAEMGAFMPVYELMAEAYLINPELYQELSQRLHTITFRDPDGVYQTETVGISLAGSQLLAEIRIPTDDLYLAVMHRAESMYRIIAALEVLLS